MNTLGSALAPLVFGVFLLPALGATWSLVLVSAGYAASLALRRWQLAVAIASFCVLAGASLDLRFTQAPPRGKLLSYKEGVSDTVAVLEHFDGNRTLLVNNRFSMGGTGAASAERRHAHIPLLLHPAPRRVLFLGLGTGISFAGAALHQNLTGDGVELVPEIVRALPWFEPFNKLPEGGSFKIFVADARRFVRASSSLYDVIVADLFHPSRDGAGSLYSLEHFHAIRTRLASGGIFCQWLPIFQLDEATSRVIVRTFLEAFPKTAAFILRFNMEMPVLGLVGFPHAPEFSPAYYTSRVPAGPLADSLKTDQIRDGLQLFGCFAAGSESLRDFSRGAPLNTDDHPVVLFGAPKAYSGSESPAWFLRLLDAGVTDASRLISPGSPEAARFAEDLTNYLAARNIYLKGLLAEGQNDLQNATDAYLASVRKSALFTSAYAQCLTLAMRQAGTNREAATRLLRDLSDAQPDRPVAQQLLQRLTGAGIDPNAPSRAP